MLLLDMMIAGDAQLTSTYNLDPDVVADIRKVLTGHHDNVLGQSVTPVGHGDFGASGPGTTLASNADLAHQHVVAALKELAEGLDGFAVALKQAADHMNDADQDSGAATTKIESSLSLVNTTFDNASTTGTTADQSTVSGKDPAPSTPPVTAPGPHITPAGGLQ